MKTHELKTWPLYFQPMLNGEKNFEARKNDRNFRVGDVLWLREWKPAATVHSALGEYTGREMRVKITYVLHGSEANRKFGIDEGYCVMSVWPIVKTISSNISR